ncbi:hypothetical protein M441DRAFT_370847 [Trichoderma asperellum CBS 433.97]|uniref:Uncharacterized protein n=1 Tax=Trichoderma asperellum (strain ATCC 204424 / CBS 433.97 / NBRC 101777) TaxID=1042311 RepID=A0A2T3ZEW4_TRIA4|nr:hypothetical protein M441DRAFT_370847 [Trichoderma asperellum CBS 433.97]PTB43351.1 hypothetical protein M441DRAFT_370847 [Trichoderma asperellum CBS 433.97]
MAIFIVNCLIGGASLRSWKGWIHSHVLVLVPGPALEPVYSTLLLLACVLNSTSSESRMLEATASKPPRGFLLALRRLCRCSRHIPLGLRGPFVSLGANQAFCSGGLSPAPSWPAFIQPRPLAPCSLQLAARGS